MGLELVQKVPSLLREPCPLPAARCPPPCAHAAGHGPVVPPPRAQGRTHLVAGLWAGGRGVTALQSEAGSLSRRGQVACPAPKPGLTAWRSATHPGLLPGVSGGTSAHSQARWGTRRWRLRLWSRSPRLQSERKMKRLTSHMTQKEHFKVISLNLTFWAFQ